jgi:hypothetical protein
MDDYKKMKVQVREAKHRSTRATLQNTKKRERERALLSLSLSLSLTLSLGNSNENSFQILNRLVDSRARARFAFTSLSP